MISRTERAIAIARRLSEFKQSAKDYAANPCNGNLDWLVRYAANYLDEIERMERHEKAQARGRK